MTSDAPISGTGAGEQELVDLYAGLLEAWNGRSAEGMAALFAEDGQSIGFDGSMMDGPVEIASTLGQIFAHHLTATYVALVRGVRMLGPDAGLVRALVGMVPRGGGDVNPAANAIQTLLAERRDGVWRIVQFQNTPAAFHGRPELVEAMTRDLREVLRSSTSGTATE